MGRPYETELEQLSATYRWALDVEVERLSVAIRDVLSVPLVCVGSGGSLTVAEFAAALHRQMTGSAALSQTPLEAVASNVNLRRAAVIMTTAGGGNRDVIGSFQRLARREPQRLIVLCLSTGTPLAERARLFPFVEFVDFASPAGRDGFLATNSLIASTVLLTRAYSKATAGQVVLPKTWNELLAGTSATQIERRAQVAWARQTLVVLHGPDTRTAALDLESKFTEAALGNVWTADFRQFAHGRHHWLAKRAQASAVLAFVTPSDKIVASKTLSLVPSGIPVIRENIPFDGAVASLSALARVMYIVGSAGKAVRIDPGRPGVPRFGQRIYHINAFPASRSGTTADIQDIAVERKTGISADRLRQSGLLQFWREAYQTYIERLHRTPFTAVALDYDGTLCSEVNRFGPLPKTTADELQRVLKAGLLVGIATGRGKSVRDRLAEAVPKEYWERVVIGYYNGGDVALLSDHSRPDGTERPLPSLRPLADALHQHPVLTKIATFEFRPPQLKIEVTRPQDTDLAWELLQQLVFSTDSTGISLLRSSHSMDILASGIDKRAVVERLTSMSGTSRPSVLCIGDRGKYPGNDYLLLAGPYGLSVDECSPDPDTGWNLAPLGYRGAAACASYLQRLKTVRGATRFTEQRQSRSRP